MTPLFPAFPTPPCHEEGTNLAMILKECCKAVRHLCDSFSLDNVSGVLCRRHETGDDPPPLPPAPP